VETPRLQAEPSPQVQASAPAEAPPDLGDSGGPVPTDTGSAPVIETGAADSAGACLSLRTGVWALAPVDEPYVYDADSGNAPDSGSRWSKLGRGRATVVPGRCSPGRDPATPRPWTCPSPALTLRAPFPPTDLPPFVEVYREEERVHRVAVDPVRVAQAAGSLVVEGSEARAEAGLLRGTPGWASPGEAPSPGGLRLSEIQLLPRSWDQLADLDCDGGFDPYVDRYLELLNAGEGALELAEHALRIGEGERVPLPARVLLPGQRVVIQPADPRTCAPESHRLRDAGRATYSAAGMRWTGALQTPEGYRVVGFQPKFGGLHWVMAPVPEPRQSGADRQPLPVGLVAGGGERLRAQPAGDLDGDGSEDLLLLEPAALKVSWGPFGPDRLGEVDPGLPLLVGGARRADSRAVGDLDGDGRADLAIPGPGADPASLDLRTVQGRSGLGPAWARVEEPCATAFVHRIQGLEVGDLTGDGQPDLLVHAPGTAAGRLALLAGPLAPVEDTVDADALWTQDVNEDVLVSEDLGVRVGDPVGDGHPRLLVHAPGSSALVLDPRLVGSLPTSAARSRQAESAQRVNLADLDGDGAAEVLSVDSGLLWATDVRLGGVYTRSAARWQAEVSVQVRAPWGQLLVAPGEDGQPDLVLAGSDSLMILPTLP
jgi:hypothetical protein